MIGENKIPIIIKSAKWIIIGVIILIIIWIVISVIFGKSNQNKLENYLNKNGFTEDEGVWTKEEKVTENETTTSTTSTYDLDINKYVKEIQSNGANYQEQYRFKYNGNNDIIVNYSYSGTEDNKNCILTQEATYNYKNKDFQCNVKYNKSDCSLHCDDIKKHSEIFGKEIEEIMDNAKVNELFLIKDKD